MGKAGSGERDVTARKLMVFVEKAMPELTRRYRSEEQYPVVSSNGMDFPLALHCVAHAKMRLLHPPAFPANRSRGLVRRPRDAPYYEACAREEFQ
ncbi:MAG: hypothetical protein IPN64_00130 [Propionivibrio sp.]|uniref:hypothetical protein n=1 Tax=Propionivibrio sp. TaxID=2212460 RepID=UPI0025ED1D3F|nr:hypothetical protein [Propionivibrio sp.]MBK8892506.1 hypothetical protein [Propionivibrio sp.]